MNKAKFLQDEVWLLTKMGSFQRANIYKFGTSEKDRRYFTNSLKAYIGNLVNNEYQSDVPEDNHIINIQTISKNTASKILQNGKLNFGVCQKLLNLFLKYQWCLESIPTPPHFPIDRIIQVMLNKEAKKLGLSTRTITSWTKMQTEVEYIEVIKYANKILENSAFENLAELELNLFERK